MYIVVCDLSLMYVVDVYFYLAVYTCFFVCCACTRYSVYVFLFVLSVVGFTGRSSVLHILIFDLFVACLLLVFLRQTLLFGGAQNAKTGEILPSRRVFKARKKRVYFFIVSVLFVVQTPPQLRCVLRLEMLHQSCACKSLYGIKGNAFRGYGMPQPKWVG